MQDWGTYYANLLIWQYRDKPKAYALIYGIVNALQSFDTSQEILDAFTLSKAVGAQLRILGTFLGMPETNNILTLSDDDYRKLLYLKVIINNSNASQVSIVDSLWSVFKSQLRVSTDNLMHIFYFATLPNILLQVAINNDLLPRPLGVSVTVIDYKNSAVAFSDSTTGAKVKIAGLGTTGQGYLISTAGFLSY